MNLSVIKPISILLLFVTLGFLIYSNTLEAPFYLDDYHNIQKNHHIRITELSLNKIGKAAFGKGSAGNRPIAYISFALNYYFHQYYLMGYHVVNIIIHILSGIFLFLFIKITLEISNTQFSDLRIPESLNPSFIAFFTALVWFVNPVHTQSVTYIVQRMTSLCAMFYVLSLLLYVKGRRAKESQKNWPWFTGSALVWILALGCKQTAATLPFFIFLYEWYFFQNLSKDWLKHSLKYFLTIIVLFCLITFILTELNPLGTIISSYAHRDFTLVERVLTEFRVVIYYLGLLFYPHPSRLKLDYDFALSHSLINPITTLLSLGAIIGFIRLACYLARKERLISFCILWFFGNLVIESSVIGLEIIFEHRTYLPSMLVFLLVVTLAFRYIKQKFLVVGLLCVVVLVSSIWTYQRNNVWKDAVSLWSDNVRKSENKARPHLNLGYALFWKGKLEDSIVQYHEALRIKPDFPEAQTNLGVTLVRQGRLQEAISHFSEALRIKPEYEEAHYNLGVTLVHQKRLQEAISHFSEALRIKPEYEEAHYNLGVTLMRQGRLQEAISHFSEALRINPRYAEAQTNLGVALIHQGRLQEAISHFSDALRIKPDLVEAHYSLGVALVRQGRLQEAISHFSEALRFRPEFAEAHQILGAALVRQGRLQEAIGHFSEALRIRPDYEEARYNLELVLRLMDKSGGASTTTIRP